MTVDVLRNRWAAGTCGRLAWMSMTDPQLLETIAASGSFDAIVLDVQHGGYDRAEVLAAVRCLGRWPITLMARIPSADPDLIGWLLDAGLDGLIVAMCDSADTARRIVSATRHMPEGTRSYGVFRVRPHDVDSIAYARQVVVLPMVESTEGLAAVHDIVAVEGVDGVFIGPGDLGLSLGLGAGQNRGDGRITDAFATIASAAHAAGKRVGIFATTVDYARTMAAQGFDAVVAWYDAGAIAQAAAAADID
jgi:4-hydroxy-2-oxoheptanedioate aldolase